MTVIDQPPRFTRAHFDSLPAEVFNAFLLIYRSLRCRIHGYGCVGISRQDARRLLTDVAIQADYSEYVGTK